MLFVFGILFALNLKSEHSLFSVFLLLFFLFLLFLTLFFIFSLLFVYLFNTYDSAHFKTQLFTKSLTFLHSFSDCLFVSFRLLILIKFFTYSAFHSKFCKVIPFFDNILSTKYPMLSTLLTAIVIS